MYKKDLVSIVIPCYNCEKYIEKCLDSLLNQTYKNLEVIVINDGSTDKTLKILELYIEKFEKNNMKLIIINQSNQGQAAAVNNGIKKVTGEFLCWQDSDDYYADDAIENLYSYLKCNDSYDFVRGNVAIRKQSSLDVIESVGKSRYPNETNIFDFYVFEKDSYCFPGIFMVKMSYFDKCIMDREIYISRAGQNWQLILPVAYKGHCGYIDKIVYNYRVLESSHSHSVKSMRGLLKRCSQHKDVLINTLKRIDMPKKMYRKYKFKLNHKYLKKKLLIVLSCIFHKLKGE